ncbi:MAG: trehalose-phosphatase [Jatrophihabitans sp.]
MSDSLERTLIALDFDGTLAPIVLNPATSRPVDGAVETLQELAGAGAQVGVITGRDARTVIELGGLDRIDGLIVAGLYGAEWWQAGELDTVDTPAAIERLRAALPDLLAAHHVDPKMWIEDKRLSLVVHARATADPDGQLAAVRAPIESLAAEVGLSVEPGKHVLELRIDGHDKGRALREMIRRTGRTRVLFGGDDLGDLPAFAVIADLAAEGVDASSVAVVSAEAPAVAEAADRVVGSPAELVELLRDLC